MAGRGIASEVNEAASIRTEDQFVDLMGANTPKAFRLAKTHPRIARLITFQTFLQICQSAMIDEAYAKDLIDIAAVGNLIQNKKQFRLVREANIHLSTLLLSDSCFSDYANGARKYAAFDYLSKTYGLQYPQEQKRQLKRPSLVALALELDVKETPKSIPSTRKSVLSAMLHEDKKIMAKKILARHLSTHKSYTENMMFGPTGYYSTGKVDFLEDFKTYATDPRLKNGFAMALAYQLFSLRNKLMKDHKLLSSDFFNVLECGAGNGDLCATMLDCITNMAKQYDEWKEFLASLRYHIVERSPSLVERQQKKTEKYKDRVSIVCADAREMSLETFHGKQMAAVISNELLDVFAAHEVTLDYEGNYSPMGILFAATEGTASSLLQTFGPHDGSISIATLRINSKAIKEALDILGMQIPQLPGKPADVLYLSEKDHLALSAHLPQGKPPFAVMILFYTSQTGSYYPQLAAFVERNPDFCVHVAPTESHLAEVGLRQYLKAAHRVLMSGGEAISIDYGDDAFHTDQFLRNPITGNLNTKDTIFLHGPWKDITHDVNFTTLAEEGLKIGLNPLFFGKQNQLTIPIGATISEEDKDAFIVASARGNFHFLVQGKEDTAKPAEISLPVTHSQLFRLHLNKAKLLKQEYHHERLVKQIEIAKSATPEQKQIILKAIKNKEYALALRKACSTGLGKMIYLILSQVKALEIDVNQSSSTASKTAYDWLQQAKIADDEKTQLLKALSDHGGKSFVDLAPRPK